MSHDRNPRGGQWLARGEDVVTAGGGDDPDAAIPDDDDHSSRAGAIRLALRIERWWRDHFGMSVCCTVHEGGFGTFVVRSNVPVHLSERRAA